jgi:hypothetical protein
MSKRPVRTIRLPCFGLTVRIVRESTAETPGAGAITTDLKVSGKTSAQRPYNAAIDGLESLILAHACGGVDIETPAYLDGIETAVKAITNQYL